MRSFIGVFLAIVFVAVVFKAVESRVEGNIKPVASFKLTFGDSVREEYKASIRADGTINLNHREYRRLDE